MATRSLTEVFILMRNNAVQNRNIYSEQNISDRVALVDHRSEDIESGRVPPSWTSHVDECQYICVKLENKLNALEEQQTRLISRPTLDDSTNEERQIELATHEISQMFNSGYRLLGLVKREGYSWAGSGKRERRHVESVCSGLAATLQNLSMHLKKTQSNYLNKINSREERSRAYFDVELEPEIEEADWSQVQTTEQLLILEDNMSQSAARQTQVKSIVDSIVELNSIFKDLSRMVIEQGTILDRIDYNIECAQVDVEQGVKQLRRAAQYQAGNKKMICVIILATVTTLLLIILIITKS